MSIEELENFLVDGEHHQLTNSNIASGTVPTINRNEAEEDASLLRFGDDFANAQPLFPGEVLILLSAQTDSQIDSRVYTDVFDSTLEYCKRFTNVEKLDLVTESRRIISRGNYNLHPYEVSQICGLGVEDIEEALALIPSLHHDVDQNSLQTMIVEATSMKYFQG